MRHFFFVLILFSASRAQELPAHSYFVVWNVGQGQWSSAITPLECHHFDMGGEFFPWKKIFAACSKKQNFVFLSHWDWDHVGALSQKGLRNKLKNLCLRLGPLGKASERKRKLLIALPRCPSETARNFQVWSPPASSKDTNSLSHVLSFSHVLIPGDSPVSQEKIWKSFSWVRASRLLVLGHHGSSTSTSYELLHNLPSVRMSVSSARWARYKHPHPQTELRLRKSRIPLLRTEDWGNLWFELEPPSDN